MISPDLKKHYLKFALILNPHTVVANARIIVDSDFAENNTISLQTIEFYKTSIKTKTRTCGSSIIDLIQASQMFQDDFDNIQTKRNLDKICRQVSDAVQSISSILTAQATYYFRKSSSFQIQNERYSSEFLD